MEMAERLAKERRARLAAERLLEQKSRELFAANEKLGLHARSLSDQIVVQREVTRSALYEAEVLKGQNSRFVVAYTQKYKSAPDQFAAQAYDALQIVKQAMGKVKLSGNLEADRKALRDALPAVTYTGATGPFKFRQAMTKDGKPAGFDAQQAAIVSVTQGGKYAILK